MEVEYEHLSFQYPGSEEPLIRNVSLELTGEYPVLIGGGPGSGKTTLAALLAGVVEADSGEIDPPAEELVGKSLMLGLLDSHQTEITLGEYFDFLTSTFAGGSKGARERYSERLEQLSVGPETRCDRIGSGKFRLCLLAAAEALRPGLVVIDDLFRPFSREEREEVMRSLDTIERHSLLIALDVPPDDETGTLDFDRWELSGGSLIPWGVHRSPAHRMVLVLREWDDQLKRRLERIDNLEVLSVDRPRLELKMHSAKAESSLFLALEELETRAKEVHTINR